MSRATSLIAPFAFLVIAVTAWDLVVRLDFVSPLILPPPTSVMLAFAYDAAHLSFHGTMTLAVAALGFLLGSFAAIVLALVFHLFPIARAAIYPYAIATRAIPLVALAPLIVIWFGSGPLSKVLLAGFIAFFPVLVSTVAGLRRADPDVVDFLVVLGATRWAILWKLRWPAALPDVFTGLKVASAFAVLGAVVAELVGSVAGIGYVIKSSSYYLDMPLMFAAIITACLVGLLGFAAVAGVARVVVFWERSNGH